MNKTISHTAIITFILLIIYTLNSFASERSFNKNFKEIEILIEAKDVKIGGTLIIPSQRKSDGLVILSSGSGWQDRDCTLFGFKSFKHITHHLGNEGIASFRYDDRSVGTSTGDFVNSTLDDLSGDVEEIINYFQNHEQHRFSEFTLFGHSKGGVVVGKVAARNKAVTKVVLAASIGVPLGDVVLLQLREEYLGEGTDISLIEAEVSAHNHLMKTIQKGKNADQATKDLETAHTSVLLSYPSNASADATEIQKKAKDFANEMKVVYGLPSLTSFLYYDPIQDLQQLNVPVLALTGGKDKQVTIRQNKDRMEGALLNSESNFQFAVFNEANHFFQKAETGNRDEYEGLKNDFVEGYLFAISSWILSEETQQVQKR